MTDARTTYSLDAGDKRQGLTAGELRQLLDPEVGIPDDAKIIVRAGGRGQIKHVRIEVGQ
jgi:hypothetical protein